MAKYRVDTDKGSYIVETEDPPAQQPPQSFGEQLWQEGIVNPARQVGAGFLGAAATGSRMTANVADILHQASEKIGGITGLQPGGMFGAIRDRFRQEQLGLEHEAAQLAGGRQDFASQLYRGMTQGVAELPTYAVAGTTLGPVAGMAAVGAIRESDQGWQASLKAAAEGALLGKALEVMGPASRPVRLTGAAAMTYAQARLNGADHTSALANATTMGALAGHRPGGVPLREMLPDMRPKSNLNPVEQRAIDFLRERDVHVDVPTQSGNRFIRGAGALAANSPLGASTAAKSRASTEAGLQRVAGELMTEAYPEAETPESAGAGVQTRLQGRIDALGKESDSAYQQAWMGRNDPQFTYEVPVRQEPILDDGGQPTGQMRDVMKPVNMPVDITEIKEQAEPLREEMEWALSRSDQSHNAAFGVLEKILKSDNYIPAWMAEKGLSALKTMARTENQTGVRDVRQGTAAGLIKNLQEQIDAAVANTGDEAIRGLEQGRHLHAQKMDLTDVREGLPAEPVKVTERLTWERDTGIEHLRRVAKETPQEMPRIGRALLERMFGEAQQRGGFRKADSLLSKWERVGPETKKILFKSPQLIENIDNFFRGANQVAINPNPSGTALVSQIGGLFLLNDPAGQASWILTTAGLAKLLYSPRGVALLTRGLRPQGSVAAAEASTNLLRLAGNQGVVPVPGGPSKVQEFLGELGTTAGKATGEFWREEEGTQRIPGEGLSSKVGKLSPAEAEAAFQAAKTQRRKRPASN